MSLFTTLTITDLETTVGGWDQAAAADAAQRWGKNGQKVGMWGGAALGVGLPAAASIATANPAPMLAAPALGLMMAGVGHEAGGGIGSHLGYLYGGLTGGNQQ